MVQVKVGETAKNGGDMCFKTPLELGHYMVETYENSEEADIAILEEQLGVSKEEWLRICARVYEDEAMRSKFTEILNRRINDLL
ncbi:MAG TPA: hypothetical protein VN374_01870 [Desulfitobacteriaceae bacterium]|nr:hypothetical protein [Desulfitobacteriaceae bacterium]